MPDPSQMTGIEWIATVVVGFIFIGLQAYVAVKAKNAATHEDLDKLTRVVEDIKAEHARELERLKSDLLKDVESHRIQYETELQTYKEIWATAYDVYNAANALRSPGTHHPSEHEALEPSRMAYVRAAIKYEAALWKLRPFYPDDVFREFENFGILLGAELGRSHDVASSEVVQAAISNRLEILRTIDRTCEIIRKRLRIASQEATALLRR